MEAIFDFEIEFTLFIQSLGHWLQAPFTFLSFLATEEFFIVMMPLIYWCVDALLGLRLAIMLVASNSINSGLKMLFRTPRPFWYDTRVQSLSMETSFGMPSGHSQNSGSLWGMLALHVKKRWMTIITILVIFLIGLSRIYLGMHFLHDVLSGWLAAAALLALYFWLEKPVGRWLAKLSFAWQIVFFFAVSLLVVLIGIAPTWVNPSWQLPAQWIENAAATKGAVPDPMNFKDAFTLAGVIFGFASGYAWWVKKFGQPKVEGSWMKRLARYFVGIVGVIALYAGLKAILPQDPNLLGYTFRYLRYTVIGLWVTAFAPILFMKLKLNR